MTEFTHARCGGNLVEIEKPDWDNDMGDWYFRCQRCRRPGTITDRKPAAIREPRFRRPALTAEQADMVRDLYEQGYSSPWLASAFDVSCDTILRAAHREGAYRDK